MKRFLFLMTFVCAFVLTAFAESPTMYFNIGNPVVFSGEKFYFAWSSHPVEGYYLQEYLPENQNFETYKHMLTVSPIFTELPDAVDISVNEKEKELDKRKESDPVCQYEVFENDGMKIIDFLVSDGSGDELNCVEHDVQLYINQEIDGKKAVVLYYLSSRAYGDDILPFISQIPDRRTQIFEALTDLSRKAKFKFSK